MTRDDLHHILIGAELVEISESIHAQMAERSRS